MLPTAEQRTGERSLDIQRFTFVSRGFQNPFIVDMGFPHWSTKTNSQSASNMRSWVYERLRYPNDSYAPSFKLFCAELKKRTPAFVRIIHPVEEIEQTGIEAEVAHITESTIGFPCPLVATFRSNSTDLEFAMPMGNGKLGLKCTYTLGGSLSTVDTGQNPVGYPQLSYYAIFDFSSHTRTVSLFHQNNLDQNRSVTSAQIEPNTIYYLSSDPFPKETYVYLREGVSHNYKQIVVMKLKCNKTIQLPSSIPCNWNTLLMAPLKDTINRLPWEDFNVSLSSTSNQ